MSSFGRNDSLLLALAVLSLVALGRTASRSPAVVRTDDPRVKVEIFNLLRKGANFTIHCTRRGDDLGTRVVRAGQRYALGFRPRDFGGWLWFPCEVSWRGGNSLFESYDTKRDRDRCHHYCKWEVRDELIYGYNDTSPMFADITIPYD